MAGKISEYPAKTVFNDTDLYDCSTAGTASEKVTYAQLKTNLKSSLSGVCGIANASGEYTYYADLQSAVTAGGVDSTIEVFTDILETSDVQINFLSGQTINFNGHSYILDVSSASNAFAISTGTVHLSNGSVYRKNVAATGKAIRCETNATLIGNDFVAYSESTTNTIQSLGIIKGITAFQTAGSVCISSTKEAHNCKGFSDTGVGFSSSGLTYNCYGKSSAADGFIGGGQNYNCIGVSTATIGFVLTTNGKAVHCSGYSDSGAGFQANSGSNSYHCSGYSTSSFGIQATTNCSFFNCSGHSTSSYGFRHLTSSAGTYQYVNCSFTSDSNEGAYINTSQKTLMSNCFVGTRAASTNALIYVAGTSHYCSGNTFSLITAANFSVSGTASVFLSNNNYDEVSTTAVQGTITNSQVKTSDSFGNIQRG